MNDYRIDRANRRITPCGMNSILYIGDSHLKAEEVFHNAELGRDAWNNPNNEYGIIFSVWRNGEYVVVASRGL